MKLLLTSTGITNDALARALTQLTGKKPEDVKIGFIPTAANVEEGNKDWFIGQLTNLNKYGYSWIDIIDPSAAGVDWETRLSETDVVYISGGNTFHLLDQVRKTGFDTWLEAHKQDKIFVGSSAGSILMTPSIAVAGVEPGDPNLPGIADLRGMSWVTFEISPHVPEMVAPESSIAYQSTTGCELYLIDDSTGILVEDGTIEVITEGKWKKVV
jgi:dipeptidase E